MKKRGLFKVKTCPICEKNFIPSVYHIYKVKGKMVCSWGCVMRAEKEEERKKAK